MFNSNLNFENDNIDFDFFEIEGDHIKTYGNEKQSDGSKIITKAVIETDPTTVFDFPEVIELNKNSSKGKLNHKKEQSQNYQLIDGLSTPTSSLENKLIDKSILDESLLNCLAYNEDIIDKQDYISFLDDKECSDNSLSDSTLTTITSDFTCVSSLSSTSDSSCASDEYMDSITLQSENKKQEDFIDKVNDENVLNPITQEDAFEIEQPSVPNESEEEIKHESKVNDEGLLFKNISDCSEIDDESESMKESDHNDLSENECNISLLEEELGDISLATQSSSSSCSFRTPLFKSSSKLRMRKKEYNLTFSREELIKIERENLILLKKIMAHSKPRTVSVSQPFNHRKTSAAINRAKQQKKIEQDNYILFNKISAMGRMKKVF